MAGNSDDVELEGEMADLEGDADMNQWASLMNEGGDKLTGVKKDKSSKVPQQSTSSDSGTQGRNSQSLISPAKTSTPRKQPEHSKEYVSKNTCGVGDIAGIIGILHSGGLRTGETKTKTSSHPDEKKVDSGAKVPSTSSSLSAAATRKRKQSLDDDSDSLKFRKTDDKNDRKDESSIQQPLNEDSDSIQSKRTNEKSDRKDESSKEQPVKEVSDSSKPKRTDDESDRKDESSKEQPVNEDSDTVKSKRTDDENDNKDESSKDVEDKGEKAVFQQEGVKDVQRLLSCSEEECRNIDAELVEEMMDNIKTDMMPKYGDKYVIKFSPVEMADLADENVQKLITAQPRLAFYFKRQGKLKKKKGYAEVYLSQIQESRIFIQKLLQTNLNERRIEITITVSKPKKNDEVLSLVIWLNKNSKLLKLIKSKEDSAKVYQGMKRVCLQIEKVPAAANALMLRTLFPFSAEVIFSPMQTVTESGYRGPINVYYASDWWLEAVLDCCSDFTYNGCSLSFQQTRKHKETKTKPESEVKKDAGSGLEKSSAQDKTRHGGSTKDEGSDKTRHGGSTRDNSTKTAKNSNSSSGSHKSETTATVSTPQDASVDDDISHMTIDLCAGMMESLKKLRQLGTDNSNVMRILQMQNELAMLQKSLSKSEDQSGDTPADSQPDPWTVSATEDIDDKQQKQGDREKGKDKKPLKELKRKQEKETRAEKQRREMDDLQRMIEEADEAKRQREERAKRQIEIEKQKMKELEEKRKSNWARKMIDDAKQCPSHVSGENIPSKEDVQRLLKIIGGKRKDAEEAKKLEEEAKEKEKESLKMAAEEKNSQAAETKEAVKASGGDDQGTLQGSSDLTLAEQGSAASGDGDLSGKLATSYVDEEKHLHTQDTGTPVGAWSPDRTLHDGAPVYSEEEFIKICSEKAADKLPCDHYIQVTYYANRRCPVQICPSTKYFKTAESFVVHWDVFHKPNVTMKFCQKCNAYFTDISELEAHLINRHSVSDPKVAKQMSKEAREKVVANPSFRDPGRFLSPVV